MLSFFAVYAPEGGVGMFLQQLSGCCSHRGHSSNLMSMLQISMRPKVSNMFLCGPQVVVGALESSGDIVSLSCCENEIFILKGDRDIIRLSNVPEGGASNCKCHCYYDKYRYH